MSPSSTLDTHIDLAVKRYSMLFTLPSQRKITIILLLLSTIGGALMTLPLPLLPQHIFFKTLFGLSLFFVVIVSDVLSAKIFLRKDVIYNFRRCLALSLFSMSVWVILSVLGGLVFLFTRDAALWFKLSLVGFAAALMLRMIVLLTTAFHSRLRILVAAFLQPCLSLVFLYTGGKYSGQPLTLSLFLFTAVSILAAMITAAVFIIFIDRVGSKNFGLSSFALLKAFLANWTENLNAPLEEFFERLGKEENIEFSIFGFKTDSKISAALVVPSFHPGPFRNVGSSPLPHMIQDSLSKRLGGFVAVSHGIFGHEFDLASQTQNQKLVEKMLGALEFKDFHNEASPFIQTNEGAATASCQVFGKHALFILTVAPKTTEDFPREIGAAIINLAQKHGVKSADLINAHNSINGVFDIQEALPALHKAAASSLEKALKTRHGRFKVGFAQVYPREFSVEDGMGPGGIGVIVVEVGGQKAAYIVIDGNNMISNLREEILNAIKEDGISIGEVMTTDTHVGSAIVLGKRGYHPVGEAIDRKTLISYVHQGVRAALSDMRQAEVSRRHETAERIKVIGEKQIETMCMLAEKSVQRAKLLALTVFPVVALFFLSLLFLI